MTIGPVKRGNPYVPKNATGTGMPDSVPPGKTYEVVVTLNPPLTACPGQSIQLSIAGTGGSNGTATVSPASITQTTTVIVTGGVQTAPGSGGNLKIQAKLDGTTLKAESPGFTVCAHPFNYTDTFASDITGPSMGVRVQDGWESDSGSIADLDEAEDSELVEYDPPTVPPYHVAGASNSSYQKANFFTQDSHSIGRPSAGPAADWERRQVCIYKCNRCGVADVDHTNSGFKITHRVFQVGTAWKHQTTKVGAAVSAKGHSSGAGTANVIGLVHNLP